MVCAAEHVRLSPQLLALHEIGSFEGGFDEWLELLFREDRARVAHLIRNAISDRSADVRTEYRISTRGADTLKWLEGRFRFLYDDQGSPSCVVAVNVDITERKRAAVELRTFTESLEEAIKAAPPVRNRSSRRKPHT